MFTKYSLTLFLVLSFLLNLDNTYASNLYRKNIKNRFWTSAKLHDFHSHPCPTFSNKRSLRGENAEKPRNSSHVGLDPETETRPYLFPADHFYSKSVKKIFKKTKAELNAQTIEALGFKVLDKLGLHVLVAKHPNIPGYVFKFFKYNDFPGIDWQHWIKRCQGAKLIQEGIETFGFKNIFKVPKKWLIKTNSKQVIDGVKYPCYVLMAEDVQPEPLQRNQMLWRTQTTEQILVSLHLMLKTYGLRDSARVANIPRCKNGKIAFVDTEGFNSWPVNHHPLIEFLSNDNRKIWKEIVTKGGDPMSPKS